MTPGVRGAVFLVALAAAFAPACASPDAETAEGEQDITTDALRSKKELFDQEMLFVRVRGWGGDPDALRDARDALRLGSPELLLYKASARSNEHCPTSGNTLVYKTSAFTLRTSGNLTNGTPKSSYKVTLEDKDDRLFGMKSLNLKSMWNDVSQMREGIAWRLFAQAGVVAPLHTYAKLCVDGKKNGQPFTKYMGLYSLIEQVDKAFAKDAFGKKNDGGNLYKAYWPDDDLGPATLGYRASNGDDGGKQYKKNANVDERTYQLKTNDKRDDDPAHQTYDDLATLIRVINGVTTPGDPAARFASPAYPKAVEEVFNAKQFLRWAALNALMGAWDNYWSTPANYYVYNSGKKDGGDAFMAKPYFTWIPWDYDNTFGIDFHEAGWATASVSDFSKYDGRSSNMKDLPLLAHLFENDAFFGYYLDALEHMNDTLFTVDHVGGLVRALRGRVETAAFLEGNFGDPAHTGRQFTNDEVARHGFEHHELRRGGTFILGVEHFVRIRHDSVARQIARLRRERSLPRGSSGATFPAAREDLPR
ncbi:MAG: CotH kinase family protein [Labilithrix sp.]|nr:CotH kinase family protein [Labilithrix sp.]